MFTLLYLLKTFTFYVSQSKTLLSLTKVKKFTKHIRSVSDSRNGPNGGNQEYRRDTSPMIIVEINVHSFNLKSFNSLHCSLCIDYSPF